MKTLNIDIDILILRKFGFTLALMFVSLFALMMPWLFNKPLPLWPWVAAGILIIPAWLKPTALKWCYLIWMKLGSILGWVNTRLILALVFFGVVTPIGVIIRLFNKDTMTKKYEKCASYRKVSPARPISHMEKPF